jgi:hypothetical protein
VRIEQIILGASSGTETSTITLEPSPSGLSVLPIDGSLIAPEVAARAIRETLTSPDRSTAKETLPFIRVTAVAGDVRLAVADDASLSVRMLTETRAGGVPLILEAHLATGEAEDERLEALLRRIAVAADVEDNAVLGAILAQDRVDFAPEDASTDELAYVEAHRRAAALAREVRAIDDRMTKSVVPDWLWIATAFGGAGVFMTVIALLYPDLRVYVVPAMTCGALIGFGAYAMRSLRELRIRGALLVERREMRARREAARSELKRRAGELVARGIDPDRVLVRLSGAQVAKRVPAIIGVAGEQSGAQDVRTHAIESERQIIVLSG